MQIAIPGPEDLETLICNRAFKASWHYDPLVGEELADAGVRRQVTQILKEEQSLALQESGTVRCVAVGSIPKWDSDFFGFSTYLIKFLYYESSDSLNDLLSSLDETLEKWKVGCCYIRVSASAARLIRALETSGFAFADIRATFSRPLGDAGPPLSGSDVMYSLASIEDIEEIAEISRLVSKSDRFHSDENYPADLADDLYYRWVVNGFESKDVVKCCVKNKVVGFHMSYSEMLLEKDKYLPLSVSDLMGVLPEYRGRGIGEGLFASYFNLARSKGHRATEAGVHLDNVASVRLHEKVGFKSIFPEVGLRKWY